MGTAPERVRMFVLCAWHSNALLKCLAVLLCLTITCTFQNLIKICVFRCMRRGSGHTLHPQTPGRERVGWALPQVPSPSPPHTAFSCSASQVPHTPILPSVSEEGTLLHRRAGEVSVLRPLILLHCPSCRESQQADPSFHDGVLTDELREARL